ncbi:MAG TPA: hypothetical protein VIK60_09540 [Vicinamibacterales bacterium]
MRILNEGRDPGFGIRDPRDPRDPNGTDFAGSRIPNPGSRLD